MNHSRKWSSLWLWRDGARQDAVCERCPRTAAVLESHSTDKWYASHSLDVVVFAAAYLPVAWVASRLVPPFIVFIVALALFAGGFCLCTAIAEYRFGTTIGKHLLGLRVVRESGAGIGFGQSVVRQLPAFLQVGWIDVLFALFTDRRQRAFELLSKTRVVRAAEEQS